MVRPDHEAGKAYYRGYKGKSSKRWPDRVYIRDSIWFMNCL